MRGSTGRQLLPGSRYEQNRAGFMTVAVGVEEEGTGWTTISEVELRGPKELL